MTWYIREQCTFRIPSQEIVRDPEVVVDRSRLQQDSRDEHGSGLKPILVRSGLDQTAIFFKLADQHWIGRRKFWCFSVIQNCRHNFVSRGALRFGGGAWCLCRGAWHWNLTKFPLISNVSYFYLGLGALFGGAKPTEAPVAVDCIALNYCGKHKRKMAVRALTNRKATSSNRATSLSSLFAFTSHQFQLSIGFATIVTGDHPLSSLYYY